MKLDAKAFAQFYRDVHDYPPFPWQQDLVERLLAGNGWPQHVDVPTSLGKTSLLDIAVFTAAAGISAAPRRMFFVVDRRLIVDDAHIHARAIADALADEHSPVCAAVASGLRAHRRPRDTAPSARPSVSEAAMRLRAEDEDAALTVTRMRGGVTWDRDWLTRPDQHAIITGTVDQIGSRLLFRGYGVSPQARPIDAALTGSNSLIIIDEAHLAPAFTTTVTAATAGQPGLVAAGPTIVTMTATGTANGSDTHTISPRDRDDIEAGKRLRAAKTMHLVDIAPTKARATAAMADALSTWGTRLATPGTVVLVVANTVARARATFNRLKTNPDIDTALLTGRSRDPDRELVQGHAIARARLRRTTQPDARPLVLVATQTVEVGINIDANALVTESAALAPLIQRLGRLNRLGQRTAEVCVVVHDHSQDPKLSTKNVDGAEVEDWDTRNCDPVYGWARHATWQHLTGYADSIRHDKRLNLTDLAVGIDASPDALRALADTAPDDTGMPVPDIPMLLTPIMASWVRTSPAPVPDTPVAPYLHGINDSAEPVTVIWRDLDHDHSTWAASIDALPPSSREGIDISVAAVKRWLAAAATSNDSDLEAAADPLETGTALDDELRRSRDTSGNVLVAAAGPDTSRVVPHSHIRPGMTIVVPIWYGGCDAFGWHPESSTPVIDIADLTGNATRQRLRIGPTLEALCTSHHGSDTAGVREAAAALVDRDFDDFDIKRWREKLGELRDRLTDGNPDSTPLVTVLDALLDAPNLNVTTNFGVSHAPDDGSTGVVLLSTSGTRLATDTDTVSTSTADKPITLARHQHAVAARARMYAENLGLPCDLVDAIEAAAFWHDEGKRELRFQIILHNGDIHLAEIAPEPLAKSGMDPNDRAAHRAARQASGYPNGARHEELSARIAAAYSHDHPLRELIVHLVASHHGHARPLMPIVNDADNPIVTIDGYGEFRAHEPVNLGHADTFARLNTRYGYWGLALMEAIVRLADHTASRLNEGADQ